MLFAAQGNRAETRQTTGREQERRQREAAAGFGVESSTRTTAAAEAPELPELPEPCEPPSGLGAGVSAARGETSKGLKVLVLSSMYLLPPSPAFTVCSLVVTTAPWVCLTAA